MQEFDGLEPRPDYIMKSIQYELPDKYQFDYMVHKMADGSLIEEERLWNMPYYDFVKKLMLSRFDSFVMDSYKEKSGTNT